MSMASNGCSLKVVEAIRWIEVNLPDAEDVEVMTYVSERTSTNFYPEGRN